MALEDPLTRRAWRRELARRIGAHAVPGELGPAELRALGRGRLRELDPSPPLQPLPERAEPELEDRSPTATAVHWIEVVLIGEDDEPIAGVRYEVELPDGRVRRGRLDAEGKVRIEGLEDAGDCKVSFPDLDQDAWTNA